MWVLIREIDLFQRMKRHDHCLHHVLACHESRSDIGYTIRPRGHSYILPTCINTFTARPIFPDCRPRVGFGFAEVPAGYVLWCRCTAELRVLNDEYTRQWQRTC